MSNFSENDKGMQSVKMAVCASEATNKLLAKYGRITPKLPVTVPHILAFGAAGTGKTTRIEAAAELMGCSDSKGNLIRLSGETVKNIEDLVKTLSSRLSWKGYLCNHGKTEHSRCPSHNHQIIDPFNPVAPVEAQMVFFDEIHVLSKDLQEKLGLIILDFRYEVMTRTGPKTVYFPKFTFAAATTKPGELLKPLRTRFPLKISVSPATDIEMVDIVKVMIKERGWTVEYQAIEIIAKMSQGTPREASNHLTGLYGCWVYCLKSGQTQDKYVITSDVALKYASTQNFTADGISQDQLRVLNYLASFVREGFSKVTGVGVARVCGALSVDAERFTDEIEPHLVQKGYIISGGRGREITQSGYNYINNIEM